VAAHRNHLRRSKVAWVAWAALAVASSLLAIAPSRSAWAADMDIAPERLFVQPQLPPGAQAAGWDCQSIPRMVSSTTGLPASIFPSSATPNDFPCLPNNVAWANLMSELGMAIAPTALHPARTTGFGGFTLSFEATFTHINADAFAGGVQYWHAGTRGAADPNTGQFASQNNSPDSFVQVYALKARKGLPFGFELTGVLGYLGNTSLGVGGGDVRWALLEGYRTGVLGYLPDVSLGAGVRTIIGASSFYLTTVGIDGEISKPLTLGDSAVLTPFLGAQRVLIFADSAAVDLTPGVDALQQCGWQGNNVPGNVAPGQPADGEPKCANKLPNGSTNNGDFNNTTTFSRARIHRWRGLVGVDYRYEVLHLSGEFAMDLTEPSAENANLGIAGDRQWTVSLEAGVSF
jgi:hypothetical protein